MSAELHPCRFSGKAPVALPPCQGPHSWAYDICHFVDRSWLVQCKVFGCVKIKRSIDGLSHQHTCTWTRAPLWVLLLGQQALPQLQKSPNLDDPIGILQVYKFMSKKRSVYILIHSYIYLYKFNILIFTIYIYILIYTYINLYIYLYKLI